MSITGRLWSDEELEATKKDKWLATLLMNRTSFNKVEMEHYYQVKQRRTYVCYWEGDLEPITIYATDERMLQRFINEEYTQQPEWISPKITQFRPVKV